MNISSPKKGRVCLLSRNTTSGAVLSFLLLSWCGAILPWVTMLGHDAGSWWRWLTLQVTAAILQGKGNRQSTTDRWVQTGPTDKAPLKLNKYCKTLKWLVELWSPLCLAFLCPIRGHSIHSFCGIPKEAVLVAPWGLNEPRTVFMCASPHLWLKL